MASIAGAVGAAGRRSPESQCKALLEALEPFSSRECSIATATSASFGINLDFFLPEDTFDQQPYRDARGNLFVADARIDNRAELIAHFGWAHGQNCADAEILHAAWHRWGERLIERVLGDYALAAWDAARDELCLLRSPLGLKPLFYAVGPRWSAFASDPSALNRAGIIAKAPDLEFAAKIIALEPDVGSTAIFADIHQVPHSHAVRIRDGSAQKISLWSPRRELRPFRSAGEAGEALRAELDRAVEAQIRHAGGQVASQLSSGRDSNAVTTSAARIMEARGEELTCLTGAPRAGFEPPAYRHHIADESGLASQTAALYPNIRHIIVRPEVGTAIAAMEKAHALHHKPLLNPMNMPWWDAMESVAAEAGTRVFLGAEAGNFSISFGGPELARDLMMEEGWVAGSFQALGAAVRDLGRSRTILNHLVGPILSPRQYAIASRLARAATVPAPRFDLVRMPYRRTGPAAARDRRPWRSYHAYRRSIMIRRDFPGKMTLARWGFEHRDPTADRRLVELCHSIPARHLFGAYRERPAYAAAFNSRLPPALRDPVKRGLQGADWADHFNRDVVRAAFARYFASAPVAELLDPEAIERATEEWPNDDSASVMAALSVASFLWVHFPG